jgi:hypothetical protein
MGYGRYRSWRYRGFGANKPSKYSVLTSLFGDAVSEIRREFLQLPDDARDELLSDYGQIHGAAAETYAKKTFSSWKNGTTNLSGKTMERLVELVPPYLPPPARLKILKSVLAKHRRRGSYATVDIDVERPSDGLAKLEEELQRMNVDDDLAFLPGKVMDAATWLYDDDVTAARAMLAEVSKAENELIKNNARREIDLLKRTIKSGQIKSATYKVEMPAGTLCVVARTPSVLTKISRFFS